MFSCRNDVCDRMSRSRDMENPVRKRRRPAVACTECRRRKVKCDRILPCASCVLGTLTCAYNSPNTPIQNPGPSASLTTDASFRWSRMPFFVTPDSGLQRLYSNSESYETPTLDLPDTIHHGLDNPSVIKFRGFGGKLDAIPGSSDVSNRSSPRTSVRDAPISTKSSMSRGTHLTPNHWKNVFKEV